MGVLIQIYLDNLVKVMGQIYKHSNRLILIGEYFNRTPVAIDYQGQQDKLFKMNFGKIFLENFHGKVVDYVFLRGHVFDNVGFGDITWWLFEKPRA